MGKKWKRVGKGENVDYDFKAAAILFTDGKSMLLLRRSGGGDYEGTWALPGGRAEKGESDIGNAIRETLEECGLTAIPGYRFDAMTTTNGKQKFTAFLYKVTEPFDVHISREHTEAKWVNFDDLDDIDLHPKFKEVLPEYLSMIRRRTTSFKEWAALTDQINLLLG